MSRITTYYESVVTGAQPTTTNLFFWFRANSGITKDGADKVSQWDNQVSGEPDLVQAVSGKQPLLVTNQLNGKSIVRFDGIDDFMQTVDRAGVLSQPNSFFIVFKVFSTTNSQRFVSTNDVTNNAHFYWQNNFMRFFAGFVKTWTTTDAPPFVDFMVFELIYDGATSFAYENKILKIFIGVDIGTQGADSVTLGAYFNGTLNSEIDVAEFLFYNDIKSGNTRNDIYTYIKEKYGFIFTLSLDGIDEHVNIDPVVSDLATTTKGAWSAWITPVDAVSAVNTYIVSFSDTSDDRRLSLLMSTQGKLWFIAENVSMRWSLRTDNQVFNDGVRAHVMVVQPGSGGDPVLYIDKVAVQQTFLTSTDKQEWFSQIPQLDNARLGDLRFDGGAERDFFNGTLKNITFWNDDFTAGEVEDLFDLGISGDPTTHDKAANLVTHYPVNAIASPTLADPVGGNDGTMNNMDTSNIIIEQS